MRDLHFDFTSSCSLLFLLLLSDFNENTNNVLCENCFVEYRLRDNIYLLTFCKFRAHLNFSILLDKFAHVASLIKSDEDVKV